MKLQLIGYTEHKEHTPANTGEWQDHDEGGIYYTLYFKGDGLFKVEVSSTYGSCGSGYTSASWGYISQIEEIREIPSILTKVKKDVFIELTSAGMLNVQFQSPIEPWDAEIEQLLSTEGEIIAESTGDGGCRYYSSGEASINKELFV